MNYKQKYGWQHYTHIEVFIFQHVIAVHGTKISQDNLQFTQLIKKTDRQPHCLHDLQSMATIVFIILEFFNWYITELWKQTDSLRG